MRTLINSVVGSLLFVSFQVKADCPVKLDCTITPVVFELITRDSMPTIRGTAEPSTQLTVTVAGATYETQVDENANWSIDLKTATATAGFYRPNHSGYNDVALLSLSSDGRRLTDATDNELLIDLVPPKTPQITPLTTGDTTPVLSGFADPYGVSSLSVAGATYALQTVPDGSWQIHLGVDSPVTGTYLPPMDKPIDIVVRTIDLAGNVSTDQTQDELSLRLDADFDGIANVVEGWRETADGKFIDSDQDGTPDYLDVDSDNDGILDSIESGGKLTLLAKDADLDNIDDAIDASINAKPDADRDGIDDYSLPPDRDYDGKPDYIDTDSDNDGIPDLIEGHGNADGDRWADYLDTDSDNDGILDSVEGVADTDNDGLANYLDIDSDNDSIPDRLETGDHDGDQIPDRLDLDSDNDGIGDVIESAADSDLDGVADYLDLDSDNDGVPDLYESTPLVEQSAAMDRNRDGVLDTPSNEPGKPHALVVAAAHPNMVPVLRARRLDTDGDGLADTVDLDSDNDGVPDITEGGGQDTDLNGLIDGFVDINQNGISDSLEEAVTVPGDADDDQHADLRDLDSDNDGTPDLTETYGGPLAQSGMVHAFVDNNGDGLDDLMALSHAKKGLAQASQVEDQRLIASPPLTETEVELQRAPVFKALSPAGCSISAIQNPSATDPLLMLLAALAGCRLWRNSHCRQRKPNLNT